MSDDRLHQIKRGSADGVSQGDEPPGLGRLRGTRSRVWLPEWLLVWPRHRSRCWQRASDQVAVDIGGDAVAFAQCHVSPSVEGEEAAVGQLPGERPSFMRMRR